MHAAMSTPSLQDRKDFFKWTYARQSFWQVHKGSQFLASPPVALSEEVTRILLIGLIVTYARPFTGCHGLGTIPAKDVVPPEYENLHDELMAWRHKQGAHLDAVDYHADDPTFGNINQVRIRIKPGLSEIVVFSTYCPQDKLSHLAQKLYDKAVYHVEKFRTKYIEKSNLRRGEYRLNIDPVDPRPFIKLP
jgi:hypothetical protein